MRDEVSRRRRRAHSTNGGLATLVALVTALTGCGGDSSIAPSGAPSASPARSATAPRQARSTSARPTPTPAPTTKPRPSPTERADPRWRFYTADRHRYTSPWFAGSHRIMIGFGCTEAPYYDPDPRCPGDEGFHHGIDVAMPCGTPLFSAVTGTVLGPDAPGSPGAAYGVHPFRIQVGDRDILVGHTRTVFVRPGDQVHPGERIALSSDSGAPDGCHLHFEVRPHGGGYETAVDPAALLRLRRV